MEILKKAAENGRQNYPRSLQTTLLYGTAGIRMRADNLDYILYRMGLLSVLFSKFRKGQVTGLMVTASHNPVEDNGVKLIDTMGEMMPISWEKHATKLLNVSDDMLESSLEAIVKEEGIDIDTPAVVCTAMDTRPSSAQLSRAAVGGINALGGESRSFGLLTTPQLHYIVCCLNTNHQYGLPTEDGYYSKLTAAFLKFNKGRRPSRYLPRLHVDLANGVSAPKIQALKTYLGGALDITTYNDGSSGKLNYQVRGQLVSHSIDLAPGMRCASFDGDGDRIVYFYRRKGGQFALLDGDKIATLFASFLSDLVKASGLKLNLGLVQTAYANGSSTKYITEIMKVPVACVPTGVKHLHHKAGDFDIGVYFEANGHGTVLFSEGAQKTILHQAGDDSLDEATRAAAGQLVTAMDMINQTVGDAISDLLLVETILAVRDWTCGDWDAAYTDLPSVLLKVKVEDRTIVKTTDAERRATSPPGLQAAIDELVAGYKFGRAFVRPSGTEDVMRVYAEADTKEHANKLAYEVGLQVYNLARGIGEKPQCPA
ncbi:hypothetical protein EGW08_004140 [Elysia chlorotica]|uniref:Phosphoacetylglucosamine mutase n=1 Tax=Elysia chlorotica TaxID=188477 RepID=A0A433U2N9_ELYCH|nr:hypothetical protein EGW08_004140 [Elysia chlorotica]